jgi:hypothetical protein
MFSPTLQRLLVFGYVASMRFENGEPSGDACLKEPCSANDSECRRAAPASAGFSRNGATPSSRRRSLIAASTCVSSVCTRVIPRARMGSWRGSAAAVFEAEIGTAPEALPAATRTATTAEATSKRITRPRVWGRRRLVLACKRPPASSEAYARRLRTES